LGKLVVATIQIDLKMSLLDDRRGGRSGGEAAKRENRRGAKHNAEHRGSNQPRTRRRGFTRRWVGGKKVECRNVGRDLDQPNTRVLSKKPRSVENTRKRVRHSRKKTRGTSLNFRIAGLERRDQKMHQRTKKRGFRKKGLRPSNEYNGRFAPRPEKNGRAKEKSDKGEKLILERGAKTTDRGKGGGVYEVKKVTTKDGKGKEAKGHTSPEA